MIKWPTRAKAAIRKLFQPLQDIEIFVEDENDEVFYRALLSRVAGPDIRIARILGLGGRKNVIDAANAYLSSQKPALFLIDGDLDWVRGAPPHSLRIIHRHDAYCVENLLLCEKAISYIISQEIAVTEDEAKAQLNFELWVNGFSDSLVDLFAAYATLQEFAPEQKTVSTGVGILCTSSKKGKCQTLEKTKVSRAKRDAIKLAEAARDKQSAETFYIKTLARIKALPRPIDAVSGKDFIFPLLHFELQRLGCRITRRSLRMRLAASCDTARLSNIKNAILEVSSGLG